MIEDHKTIVNLIDRLQKRIFDISVSMVSIILLLPVFVILSILVWFDLKQVFFKQHRVGFKGQSFELWKFKTRRSIDGIDESEVDFQNKRLTRLGAFLRRSKLDELPQIFQVLLGQMSIIGPRPELLEYTRYHTKLREAVLNVKPGLIDLAAIKYFDEDKILLIQEDPKSFYIKVLLREKLRLSLITLGENNFTRLWMICKALFLGNYFFRSYHEKP